MITSIFKLTLTNKGKEALTQRFKNKNSGPIPLLVALGSGSAMAKPTDTQLANLEIEVVPTSIEPDTELIQGLHIIACFPAEKKEFEIKEIGLLLKDINDSKILFGRYASETTIARKEQVDLLLDIVIDIGSYSAEHFIINSDDYKPQFSLAKATDQRYGNVRFANRDEVLEKKPNLALSIDILSYPHILPKKALRDAWSKFETHPISKATPAPAVIGVHYQQQSNQIAILLVPDTDIKKLSYLFYNISKKNISIVNDYTTYNYSLCNTFAINQEKNKILFLINCKNTSNEIHKIPIPNSTKQAVIAPEVLFSTDNSPGALLYFNNLAYAIGAYDNWSNKIIWGEKKSDKESTILVNKRKKPLVHLIQDKVYILGGSQTSESNYTSVEIFDPINNRSFAPFTSQIDEISNTENVTSCVLENNIYVFFIKQFEKEYKRDKFYYCYDYLGNNWKKRAIAQDIQLDNPEINLQGKAITIGDEIYLFFTNTISGDNKKFELSVIKLQPI